MGDLRLPVRGKRQNRNYADARQRQEHGEEICAVGQLKDDALARAQSVSEKVRSNPLGLLSNVAERERTTAIDDRDATR